MEGKEMYTRISITGDYTVAERKMIRDFVEKAKSKTENLEKMLSQQQQFAGRQKMDFF